MVSYYVTPAGFNKENRLKRSNCFPIFFNLYGLVFKKVINILKFFTPFNKGVIMDIKGIKTLVSVYIIVYIGNII